MNVETNKLKDHPLNISLFTDIKGDDFRALKEDIKKNGIKTELHITKEFVVLCGHQRLKVAKELGLKHVPAKIIDGLNTIEQQEEYIIKDNVLRRHLTVEQRYILLDRLSRIYEIGRGVKEGTKRGNYGNLKDATVASSKNESVLEKTAKETGVSERTIATARAYVKEIKKNPELEGKAIKEVIKRPEPKAPEPEMITCPKCGHKWGRV